MKTPAFKFNYVYVLGLIMCLAIAGCTPKTEQSQREITERVKLPRPINPPAVSLEDPQTFLKYLHPTNQDMQSWAELAPSIENSLEFVNRQNSSALAINEPHLSLTWGEMSATLTKLKELLPELDYDLSLFEKNFKWIPMPNQMDYSGYYEPNIKASLVKTAKYTYPLYAKPKDLDRYKRKHKRYHDRKTIDGKGILKNKGLELAWIEDPVDAFYLQIQGSGKLIFEDGTSAYINYAGQNGHKYKSSGRIMREQSLLQYGHIYEQRSWLKANPHRVNEILFQNPSYVFFRLGSKGPTGAMGHVVYPWSSLATDRRYIPLGSVVAYGVNLPHMEGQNSSLRAIGLAQDVGGAIKKNRIDIFSGSGVYAEHIANKLDKRGPAWVLVAK